MQHKVVAAFGTLALGELAVSRHRELTPQAAMIIEDNWKRGMASLLGFITGLHYWASLLGFISNVSNELHPSSHRIHPFLNAAVMRSVMAWANCSSITRGPDTYSSTAFCTVRSINSAFP